MCSYSLKPLAHIFYVSLLFGELPVIWKEALVAAIPKVGNPSLIGDYDIGVFLLLQ